MPSLRQFATPNVPEHRVSSRPNDTGDGVSTHALRIREQHRPNMPQNHVVSWGHVTMQREACVKATELEVRTSLALTSAPFSISLSQSASSLAPIAYINTVLP
eukprot:3619799-Rhodomonas_salina.1